MHVAAVCHAGGIQGTCCDDESLLSFQVPAQVDIFKPVHELHALQIVARYTQAEIYQCKQSADAVRSLLRMVCSQVYGVESSRTA